MLNTSHLDILEYLAWESRLFADYIGSFRRSPKSQAGTSGSGIRRTSAEPEAEDECDDTGGDIWTEFETASHLPWMLELRVITSIVHQLEPLSAVQFQLQGDTLRWGAESVARTCPWGTNWCAAVRRC